MPWPGGLVVKKGSKIRDRTCVGDPRPAVDEGDLDLVGAGAAGADEQRAAAVHRLERVAGEAQEHLAELALVGDDLGERGVEVGRASGSPRSAAGAEAARASCPRAR